MTVPIHLIGHPVGLEEEGSVLAQAMREIKVLCEPANTPDSIDADVTELAAGHSLHVSDLKFGEGIEIHESPESVVASIIIVKEVVLEPQIVEEGAEPVVEGEEPPVAEPDAEGGDKE
jgi:large subunit ribosomal protein L25